MKIFTPLYASFILFIISQPAFPQDTTSVYNHNQVLAQFLLITIAMNFTAHYSAPEPSLEKQYWLKFYAGFYQQASINLPFLFSPLNQTVVHPIDEKIPFYGFTKEGMKKCRCRIICNASGL